MLRGVIFDLDGTLGDTLPVCYRAFARVFAKRLGRHYTNSEIHAMFGPSEEGILARLCPGDPAGALRDYLSEYRLAHSACPSPFGGIPELLACLRDSGVDLAIVTGKGPHSARISLESFGLPVDFAIVEAGSADGAVKPAAMLRVLARWGFPPDRVASTGDAPSDIRAAKQVGITSVAAAWAPGADIDRLAASKPDFLFREVSAMSGWLAARLGPVKR